MLKDGRLLVICDHDDYSHCHEDQPPGIWRWKSGDEGKNWSEARLTGVPGIEPDRIVEVADGTLFMGSQMTFRSNRKIAEFVLRSTDGGRSWSGLSMIAQDRIHHHCEGAIVVLRGGELACIDRENNHNGYPSYVSFSGDNGRTWSTPQPLPFAGDRPYAKQLRDGRVLVTYRNQKGNRGTHAWLGDLHRDIGYQPGGTHYDDDLVLAGGCLRLVAKPGAVTRYTLLPPESSWSDVVFEAELQVQGPADQAAAAAEISRVGQRLDFTSNGIWINGGSYSMTDRRYLIDMTRRRTVRLEVIANRVVLSVDGKPALNAVIFDEAPLRETWFGGISDSGGESTWFRVRYSVKNMTEPNFEWRWAAASGAYPDQYQIDRVLEVRGNPPRPGSDYPPDNGYSSWLEREDGSVYMVDYTNQGDPKPTSHLYKAELSPADFA